MGWGLGWGWGCHAQLPFGRGLLRGGGGTEAAARRRAEAEAEAARRWVVASGRALSGAAHLCGVVDLEHPPRTSSACRRQTARARVAAQKGCCRPQAWSPMPVKSGRSREPLRARVASKLHSAYLAAKRAERVHKRRVSRRVPVREPSGCVWSPSSRVVASTTRRRWKRREPADLQDEALRPASDRLQVSYAHQARHNAAGRPSREPR
eukprot:scaffold98095_cov58-Phaeocystis_antarctica.AAC.8